MGRKSGWSRRGCALAFIVCASACAFISTVWPTEISVHAEKQDRAKAQLAKPAPRKKSDVDASAASSTLAQVPRAAEAPQAAKVSKAPKPPSKTAPKAAPAPASSDVATTGANAKREVEASADSFESISTDCTQITDEKSRKKCELHQKALTVQLKAYPDSIALTPGKPGLCIFHSQREWNQDQYVFKKLGGSVDTGSCQVKKWMRWTPFDDHTIHCKCVAPGEKAFNRQFFEIGAADGVYLSNTLFFESQMGWRGLCVEGSPTSYALLKQNRPGCVNVNAVIGDAAKLGATKTFYSFDRGLGDDGVVGGWQVGMSCMEGFSNCRTAKDAKKFAKDYKRNFTTAAVQVKKLSDLFAENELEHMAYMSIDVEGAEKVVLRTIDFTRLTGKLLVNVEGHDEVVKKSMVGWGFTEVKGSSVPKVDAWFERSV